MALSVAAAIPTAVTGAFPSRSSDNSKRSHFSSLQFPSAIRNFRIRNHRLNSKLRRRSLTLFASKAQEISSVDEILDKSHEKPVLVDFYATWCGPCQFMFRVLDKVSSSMIDKIKVVKLDTDKYSTIADDYKIEALPTFILFKDGKQLARFEGVMAAEVLIQRIEASLQV